MVPHKRIIFRAIIKRVCVVIAAWSSVTGEVAQAVCHVGVGRRCHLWHVSAQCVVCQETVHRQGT